MTRILLALLTVCLGVIAWLWFRPGPVPVVADEHRIKILMKDSIEKKLLLDHSISLISQRDIERNRHVKETDSLKRVIKGMKGRAYAVTRFIPAPGTPCDTAVIVRDSIIIVQDGLLVEDSMHISRINVTLDSVQADYVKYQRLSDEQINTWQDRYRESEKRAADIDRKWRRKRRGERILEGLIVIGTIILAI